MTPSDYTTVTPLTLTQFSGVDAEQIAAKVVELEALGEPGKIVDHLLHEGVFGVLGDARECPLAVYLQRATGEAVCVVSYAWHVHTRRKPWPCGPISGPLREFVRRFDQGCYPELTRFGRLAMGGAET